MIRLRPHHLLCTQGYSGKGYSTAFVRNMDDVVDKLRNSYCEEIEIIFSTDSICSACPSTLGENQCVNNSKVNEFDNKVVGYFGIEEKAYNYKELIQLMNTKMTDDMLVDICGTCDWFPISKCRKEILGKNI